MGLLEICEDGTLTKMIVAPPMDRIISFSCTGMSAISANANYTAQIRGDSAKSTIKEICSPALGYATSFYSTSIFPTTSDLTYCTEIRGDSTLIFIVSTPVPCIATSGNSTSMVSSRTITVYCA